MKIAVDFDGTIVEHRFPAIGVPLPFAFEALKALQDEGNQLILWSNREGKHLQEAVDFCKQNGLEFYSVNSEYPDSSWSSSGVSRKLVADVYIDDRNLGGLPDWGEIYSMLSKKPRLVAEPSEHHRHHHSHRSNKFSRYVPDFILSFFERCRVARTTFKL